MSFFFNVCFKFSLNEMKKKGFLCVSKYRNDPKFLVRQFWASSADPDQTARRGAV